MFLWSSKIWNKRHSFEFNPQIRDKSSLAFILIYYACQSGEEAYLHSQVQDNRILQNVLYVTHRDEWEPLHNAVAAELLEGPLLVHLRCGTNQTDFYLNVMEASSTCFVCWDASHSRLWFYWSDWLKPPNKPWRVLVSTVNEHNKLYNTDMASVSMEFGWHVGLPALARIKLQLDWRCFTN